MAEYQRHPASFRDPSGFVFFANGKYYRQVNQSYAKNFELLVSSGLYSNLISQKFLVPHEVIDRNFGLSDDWYKTLLPQQLSFISYPYEWCFDELKDAALLTLSIMRTSIDHGMVLKDATSFNIQFDKGRPVFIDSLSFEVYDRTKPWIAYRQFCECFLFPLLLGHYLQTDMQKLLTVYSDGIPVNIASKLLPIRSRLSLSVWLHVLLQNSVGKKADTKQTATRFTKEKLIRLIDHLQSSIKRLHIKSSGRTTWNNYYDETILSNQYLEQKEIIFRELMSDVDVENALDLGCNNGYFSKIIAEHQVPVVAVDFDGPSINHFYLSEKNKLPSAILPLCIDLTNPSPAIGIHNDERSTFLERAKSDLVIALAIVHHLVLSKNIPMADVALMLANLTRKALIVEFVPLSDPKSQQLIENKTEYHKPYDANAFELCFSDYFEMERKEIIPQTDRILYRMKRKQ